MLVNCSGNLTLLVTRSQNLCCLVELLTMADLVSCDPYDRIEVPDDPEGDEDDDKRLWIGNLDSQMTEFAILKLVQKFGSIRKIDFIYHKSGPDKGKSKGYCFVSFHAWEAAEKARKTLDGKMVLSRPMYVKWARGSKTMEMEVKVIPRKKYKPSESSSSSSPVTSSTQRATVSSSLEMASAEAKIKAIEAKLHLMEQTQKDFSIDATIKPPPGFNPLSTAQKSESQSTRSAPYRKTQNNGFRQKRR